MAALVLELQKEALSKDIGLTDLLRKTYFVARKLKVTELENWVNHELQGYPSEIETPSYREIVGTIKVHNPYHGWQVVMIPQEMNWLTKRNVSQAASELEHLLKNSQRITMEFPMETSVQLMRAMNVDLKPSLHIPAASIHRILDSVKNLILNWAIKLEEDGILGDDISFSAAEIQKAAQANYNVTNIYGDVVDSQLQQGTSSSKQKSRK